MANRRITVQIDFNGPNPLIINSNGTFDKRLSLVNLARLLRGIDQGSQRRGVSATKLYGPPTVVVQATTTQASATVTPAAVANADTITIAGTALTATQRRATATVTFATAIAGNTVTINGVVFTAVNGAVTPGAATFDISGGNTTGAASLASQVNAYAFFTNYVGAKSAAAVCTLYSVSQGTGGNAYTLTTSGATVSPSGATFANGAAITNNTFDFAGSDALTGAAIAAAIAASTTTAIKSVNAVAASNGVVTVTAKAPGVAGNAVTFVSSNGTRLAVTGSGFLAGGTAGAPTQWTF